MTKSNHLETVHNGVIAGTAGGLAEIAWVTVYAGVTGGNAAIVARHVTTAAGLSALFPGLSAALGVTLHMTLAVGLGIALAFGWRAFSAKHADAANPFPVMIAALAGVWAVNFLVVLPIVSPSFVHLMPYSVSLISKMLFGLAAAEAFRRQDAAAQRGREMVFASSAS
jgi:hypothetical protein